MEGKIKNLLIDFGGVLVNLNRERCIRSFKTLGFEDIERLIDPYRQSGFFLQLEKGEITTERFREEVRQRISGRSVTDQQIDEAWNSFLIDIPVSKLDLLLELRRQYAVFLLSNTNEIHWQWACTNGFAYKGFRAEDYFEKQFLSFEMGQVKPERDIFQTVLDQAGICSDETFFIDDSPENCRMAESMGIQTYSPVQGEDWGHLFRR